MNRSAEPCTPPDPVALWTLAAQPDHDALLQLQSFLAANRQRPVCIAAGDLRRPDTLLLQMLVSACRDWTARGLTFRLADAPQRIVALLPLLGLRPDMIGIEAR
jgi:anti-anti-sigma regulatory factor